MILLQPKSEKFNRLNFCSHTKIGKFLSFLSFLRYFALIVTIKKLGRSRGSRFVRSRRPDRQSRGGIFVISPGL